jgi:hypothetical protein
VASVGSGGRNRNIRPCGLDGRSRMGKKTSRKNFRASGQCGRRGGELRNTHVRVGRILSRGGAKPLKQRTTIEINKNIRWVPPRGMCPLDRVFEILIGWIKEPRGPAR